MARKRIELATFDEFILPQLRAKHKNIDGIRRDIGNFDIYEKDAKGREVPVQYSITGALGDPDDDEKSLEERVKIEVDSLIKQYGAESRKNNPHLKHLFSLANGGGAGKNMKSKIFKSDERAKAFAQFVVNKGMAGNNNFAGGTLIPDEFSSDVIDLVVQYGAARQSFRVRPMRSDTLIIPRFNSRSVASYVGEGAAGTPSTPSTDNVMLVAKKLMVLVLGTSELLEDARDGGGIDLADWLAQDAARAIALAEDQAAFVGDGTLPFGGHVGVVNRINTVWADTANSSAGVQIATGNLWAEVVLSDLTTLTGKLPTYARRNAKWFCSPQFADSVLMRLLITSAGGANIAEVAGGPTARTLLGYPIQLVETMATSEANSQIPLLFGDGTQAASFGDRRQLNVELVTTGSVGGVSLLETDQFACKVTSRFTTVIHDVGDGTVAGPMVALRMAAS